MANLKCPGVSKICVCLWPRCVWTASRSSTLRIEKGGGYDDDKPHGLSIGEYLEPWNHGFLACIFRWRFKSKIRGRLSFTFAMINTLHYKYACIQVCISMKETLIRLYYKIFRCQISDAMINMHTWKDYIKNTYLCMYDEFHCINV